MTNDESVFVHGWNHVAGVAWDHAERSGFHGTREALPSAAEMLVAVALMHSELSEAVEEVRDNPNPTHTYYRDDGKPEGFGFELADVIIRIMDTAHGLGLPLAEYILEKMAYNARRGHLHGGKAL